MSSSVASSSVDVVVEKATLDALLAAEPSPWTVSTEAGEAVDK